MSRDGRFSKGQSSNYNGRPKGKSQHKEAFDILFDKEVQVRQGGKLRDLTIEEALELTLYQNGLAGSRPAMRKVLKMIRKRELAILKREDAKIQTDSRRIRHHYVGTASYTAMIALEIAVLGPSLSPDPDRSYNGLRVSTWVTQAALSRPGRKPKYLESDIEDIKLGTFEPEKLVWPRSLKEHIDGGLSRYA